MRLAAARLPPACASFRREGGGAVCSVREARLRSNRGKVKVVPSVYDLGFFHFFSFLGTARTHTHTQTKKTSKPVRGCRELVWGCG